MDTDRKAEHAAIDKGDRCCVLSTHAASLCSFASRPRVWACPLKSQTWTSNAFDHLDLGNKLLDKFVGTFVRKIREEIEAGLERGNFTIILYEYHRKRFNSYSNTENLPHPKQSLKLCLVSVRRNQFKGGAHE